MDWLSTGMLKFPERYFKTSYLLLLVTKKYTSKFKTCSSLFSLKFFVNDMPFIHYLEFYLRT